MVYYTQGVIWRKSSSSVAIAEESTATSAATETNIKSIDSLYDARWKIQKRRGANRNNICMEFFPLSLYYPYFIYIRTFVIHYSKYSIVAVRLFCFIVNYGCYDSLIPLTEQNEAHYCIGLFYFQCRAEQYLPKRYIVS